MNKYQIVLKDETTLEIICRGMTQKYGFLVFTDIEGEDVYGIRVDEVHSWGLQVQARDPVKVSKFVIKKGKKR